MLALGVRDGATLSNWSRAACRWSAWSRPAARLASARQHVPPASPASLWKVEMTFGLVDHISLHALRRLDESAGTRPGGLGIAVARPSSRSKAANACFRGPGTRAVLGPSRPSRAGKGCTTGSRGLIVSARTAQDFGVAPARVGLGDRPRPCAST